MDQYMTTDELADRLRTTAGTVRYWRSLGRGPRGTKIGRKVIYAESDVVAWLAEMQAPEQVA
jgi:predicted DNA-binding transcriptional regulator AlpA